MGQHLELVFVNDNRIEDDKLREVLANAGVTGKKWDGYLTGGGYGWMTWANSGQPVALFAGHYDGICQKHFVRLGIDSAVLPRQANLGERKGLVDEFLKLGSQIWRAFPFYEGSLSLEEEGPLLSPFREHGVEEVQRVLPLDKIATFLSKKAAELVQPYQWVRQTHPLSTITSLERESLLIIWDASSEGLARFLSEEFSIE